ncbi:MAG: hypothetical protein ACPGJV_06520 [Bacteriovoracaceae bacterium]
MKTLQLVLVTLLSLGLASCGQIKDKAEPLAKTAGIQKNSVSGVQTFLSNKMLTMKSQTPAAKNAKACAHDDSYILKTSGSVLHIPNALCGSEVDGQQVVGWKVIEKEVEVAATEEGAEPKKVKKVYLVQSHKNNEIAEYEVADYTATEMTLKFIFTVTEGEETLSEEYTLVMTVAPVL